MAGFVWVWQRYGDTAVRLLSVRPRADLLLASFACGVLAFVVFVVRWRQLLAAAGQPIGLAPLAWFRAAGATLSALVPSGKLVGEPLRMLLAVRHGVSVAAALATVAVDRTLEFGASAPFACLYTGVLVGAGVHEANRAFVSVTMGTIALAIGAAVAVRRLRLGRGVVSAFARAARLDRLRVVRDGLGVVEEAEAVTVGLVGDRGRVLRWFALGMLANAANFFEYQLLLLAFGLPSSPFHVVAAIVAAEVSRSVPVPAAIGALEGAEVWLFSLLGFPPDVGLAVGLALRLREMLWLLPGGVYLLARGLRAAGDDSGAFVATA